MLTRCAALTLTVALLAGPSTARDAAAPEAMALADGTELVFLKVPRAESASLRVMVHTGSASDPRGLEGLAHLLEHLVFHGTYSLDGEALQAQARWAGATINGFTSPDTTTFTLDAPADEFEPLLASFLRVVTNPAISLADVQRELGVIATESKMFSRLGILWVADHFVFPGVQHGATITGSEQSRRRIRVEDLKAFYARYYRPSNMTLVVVGDLDRDEIVAALERHSLLAPEIEPDRTQQRIWPAALPVDMKFFAPITATVYGFRLDPVEHAICLDLARLLDLRLNLALTIDRTLVSAVSVHCVRMRGNDFVFAFAFSQRFEVSDLPDILRRTFRDVRSAPTTGEERARILGNHDSEMRMARTSPARLADLLATEVSVRRSSDQAPRGPLRIAPPRLSPGALSRTARDSFVDGNEIMIYLSPFAG